MRTFLGKLVVAAALLGVLGLPIVYVHAEEAILHLKSGLRLRGDVTRLDDEVVLRNAAGETRFKIEDIERIEPVGAEAPDAQPVPTVAPAPPKEAVADTGEEESLAPAAWLSDDDILRLKLGELTRDGPAERLQVRFKRRSGQTELPDEVLALLRKRQDFDPRWAEILTRGRPNEQLQLIVRETGIRYLDRIEVRNDPDAFRMYRRQVLPLVSKSCARSGCHGGTSARVFRFPIGSSSNDAYTYTSFALLDEMKTAHGPLIDREHVEKSPLLTYMLPRENNPRAHPPVGRGPSFKPVLRDKSDPRYAQVVDWINFLLLPRPDYELTYQNAYRGPFELTVPPEAAPSADASRVPDGDEPSE